MTNVPIRVLLVDDDRDTVEMYAEFLNYCGMEVQTALRGADALRMVEADLPDVVVTDLRLPGMTGMELAQAVKGLAITATSVVIILTGMPVADVEPAARAAGCDAVLMKPCAPDTLVAAIRTAVLRQQSRV